MGGKISLESKNMFAPGSWDVQDLGAKESLESKLFLLTDPGMSRIWELKTSLEFKPLFLLPEWKFPGNSLTGGVQPMVPPVREFPGNFLTGAAEA